MIKLSVILIFISLSALPRELLAQTFRGRVLDIITKKPIIGATVKSSSSTSTNAFGDFMLNNVNTGDTIKIVHIGYKSYIFTFNNSHPGLGPGAPTEISLQPNSILLKEVAVRSFRNSKLDSLKNREQFAASFNYKATAFKDVFIMKDPESRFDRERVHRGNNPYSASSLISVDLLQLVSLLGKNKTAPSKLQQTLLADEENKYIDNIFSAEMVGYLTKLRGDSLKAFMVQYRPSTVLAKKMTNYEMVSYIKKKYLNFISFRSKPD